MLQKSIAKSRRCSSWRLVGLLCCRMPSEYKQTLVDIIYQTLKVVSSVELSSVPHILDWPKQCRHWLSELSTQDSQSSEALPKTGS